MPVAESDLELARRVDWRFLLPTGALGRVASVGPVDARLTRALTRFSDDLVVGEPAAPQSVDIAVVSGSDRGRLRAAAGLLRPGGWVYVETTGRQRRSVEKALAAEGLGALRTRWHWPGFDPCSEIVPLDEPAAVQLSLERRRARATSRLKAHVAGSLQRIGALDRAVPFASVVGRRAGGTGPSGSFVGSFVTGNAARLRLAEHGVTDVVAGLLLTPAFHTSRHVLSLLVPRGAAEPALVAKIPRLMGDRSSVEREARVLRELACRGSDPLSVPRVVALEDVHGFELLLETAVGGRPMNPAQVAQDPERCIAAGLAWLAGLPALSGAVDEAAFERLIGTPLARFARDAEPAVRELVEQTLALLEPLRTAAIPLAFEHGDLGHPNLVLRRDGSLGVIDWELAEPEGLPLCDLCFFLAYVASARARAADRAGHLAAFGRAFLGPESWGRRIVEHAAVRAGIDVSLVGPLLVATWARYVVRLPERTGSAPTDVGDTRQYAYWEQAVAHERVPARL